jgi:uncharacterized RDD family membrane protein YckC
MSTTEDVQRAPLISRWLAYWIDLGIIAAPVSLLGRLLFEPLSDLADYGRLIGALLVVLYFGYFDSRLGGGRSPGKRLLGLAVVSPTGGLLSPAWAAVRALIATTPVLLGGVSVDGIMSPIADLLTIGLGLSLAYLAIFNLPSRRSLHDLATGAVVVRHGAASAMALPMRRFHWGVVAALAFLALAAPALLLQTVVSSADLAEAQTIGRRVEALPEVKSADASVKWSWKSGLTKWDKELVVVAELRHWPADSTATVNAVAKAIYHGSEKLIADAPVTVRISRGFTLGITDRTRSEKFPLDAAQWRAQPGA